MIPILSWRLGAEGAGVWRLCVILECTVMAVMISSRRNVEPSGRREHPSGGSLAATASNRDQPLSNVDDKLSREVTVLRR